MKFLRTIRFDASDDHVFERTAGADEWAVPGSFLYALSDPAEMAGKARQAFANGFLSVESYGHATLVTVAEIDPDLCQRLGEGLADKLEADFGAPDRDSAENVAAEEFAYVGDLCADLPINTLLALSRHQQDDGQIREMFRTIDNPDADRQHARIWDVVEDSTDVP